MRCSDLGITTTDLPGIQLVKVDRQGKLQLSLATGCVAYTSWQPLHESDPFPFRSPDDSDDSLMKATDAVLNWHCSW
jgi:hypothetical protein